MGDFHIPNDPAWQWAYDAILYTVGEKFPKGDPSQLKALSVELERFGAYLNNGIAATQALGQGLEGNLDGPAADAFAQFQYEITRPLPGGIRQALVAGNVADQANQQIDYAQTQIVVAAFMIVLDIATAMASGFGVALVPAYINIGQKITQTLLNRLQNRLQELMVLLTVQGAEEGVEEGAENVAAQTIVIAKDNKDDGFSSSDFWQSVGAGAAVGTIAGGVHIIGGRYFPRFSGTTHGQAGLSAAGETLGEFAYLAMIGAITGFDALATGVSAAVGTYASRYAHDAGAAVGGGPAARPDASGLGGPGPSRDLAAGGGPLPPPTGPVGTDGHGGTRSPLDDPTNLRAGPVGSGDTSPPDAGSGSAPPNGSGPPPVAPSAPQPSVAAPAPPSATIDGGHPGPLWSGDPPSAGPSAAPPTQRADQTPPASAAPGPGLPGLEPSPTGGTASRPPDGVTPMPGESSSPVSRPDPPAPPDAPHDPSDQHPGRVGTPAGQAPDAVGTPAGQVPDQTGAPSDAPGTLTPGQPSPAQLAPAAAGGTATPTAPPAPPASPEAAVPPGSPTTAAAPPGSPLATFPLPQATAPPGATPPGATPASATTTAQPSTATTSPAITPPTGSPTTPGAASSPPPTTSEARTGSTTGPIDRTASTPSDPPSYGAAVGPVPGSAPPRYVDLTPSPPPYGSPIPVPKEQGQSAPGTNASPGRRSPTGIRSASPAPREVERPVTPRPVTTTVEGPASRNPAPHDEDDDRGHARAPTGARHIDDTATRRSASSETRRASQDEISSLRDRGPKATTTVDVVQKRAGDPGGLAEVAPATVAKSTEETPTAGDPIDVTTGRMILTETDAVLPGLTLTRTHRSDYRWGRSFGPSWASTLDQRLIIDHHHVRYLAADGSILTYPLPAEGEEAQPQLGRTLPLRRLTGGGWLLTEPTSGRTLVFTNGNGPESLLSDVAVGDNRWSILRDSAGTPTELRSSTGARIGFSSSAGLLTVLWLPTPSGATQPAYRFGYDGERNLVEVVNSSGDAERFDYTSGRIVRWEDRNGEWYTYRYDESGRCVSTDGKGGYLRYRFAYSDGLTVVTDSLGNVRSYELNDRFQVVAETDSLGATTRHEWDDGYRLLSRTDPLGRTTRYEDDADGRALTEATSVATSGAETHYTYDDLGRIVVIGTDEGSTELGWTPEGDLASRVGPDGSRQEWRYDGEGNLVESIDGAGRVVRVEYGPFDLPTARIDEAGNRMEYTYDTELRLIAVANPAGQVWRYTYDAAGRLSEETDFDGRTQRYTRDAAGQLIAHTNSADETTHYRYNQWGRVIERRAGEVVTRFEYDGRGQIVAVVNPDSVVRFERDARGRVVAETINDQTVRTSYHAELDTVQTRTTPSGRSSRWTYDDGGRPASLSVGGHLVRFAHDAHGREINRTVDDVVALRQTFDAAGRLTVQQIAGATERDFSYDATGRVTAIVDTLDGERSFEADGVGRIRSVVADRTERERYEYDALGSLTGTGIGRWEFDGTMLVRSDDATFEYDENGRLVSRSDAAGVWRFTWDAEDRIVRVVTPGGDRWRYRYDGFGRRIAKQRLAADDSVVEQVRFAWSGDLMVEQSHQDASDTIAIMSWEYRPGGSTPVAQTDDQLRTVVTDLVGTPTHLVEPSGTLRWWARSDLWGRSHGPSATPLRFPGQYFDAETGLHYNRFRFYDPATARYLSPDPLGLAGGSNPTAYVTDPLTVADPLGLTSCKVAQPGLDPLADSTAAGTPARSGEPSQLPARAAPPSPEALHGAAPAASLLAPDLDGTVAHSDLWHSEVGATPLSRSASVEDVRDRLPSLPEPGSRPGSDSNRDAPSTARRRGRVVADSGTTRFGPIQPVFTPAGLRMLHETDVVHQTHADSLPVGPDYKLAVEGVDGEIVAGGHAYDPDVIGGLIENDPGWNNRPITVVACDAGPLFAVNLAKRLPSVPVTAARTTVFTTGRGHVFSDDAWVTYTAEPDGRVTEVFHDQTHMPGGPVPSAADIAAADTHWRIATETEVGVQIGALNPQFPLHLGEAIARAPGLVFKIDSQQRTLGNQTGIVMIVEVVSGPSRVEQWEESAADPNAVREARNAAINAILTVPEGRHYSLRDTLRDVPGMQYVTLGGVSAGDAVGVLGGQFTAPYTQWTVGMHNHSLPIFLRYAATHYPPTANQTPRRLVESGLALGKEVVADFRQHTGGRALPWHERRLEGHLAIAFPAIAAELVATLEGTNTGSRVLRKHFLLLAPRKELRDMRDALPQVVATYVADRADHIKQLMHRHLEGFDQGHQYAIQQHLVNFETNHVDYFSSHHFRDAANNLLHGHRYPDGTDVPFFGLYQQLGINPTTDGIDPPGIVGGEFRYLADKNSDLDGIDRQSDDLSAMVRSNAAPPPLTSAVAHQIIQAIRTEDGQIRDAIRQIKDDLRRDRSPGRVPTALTGLLDRAQTVAARAETNESYAGELREAAQAAFAQNDPARRNARTYHHNTKDRTEAANELVSRIQRHLDNTPAPESSQPPYGGNSGPGGGQSGYYPYAETSYGPVSYSDYPGGSSSHYGGSSAPYGSGSYDPYVGMAFVDGTAADPTQPAPRVLDPNLGVDGRQRILDDLSALADARTDAVRDFLGQHESHPDHATATALWDSFVSALDSRDQADLQPVVNLYEQTHDRLDGLDSNNPLPAIERTLDDSDYLPRRQPTTVVATDGTVPNDLLRSVPLTNGTHLPVLANNVHSTTANTTTDLENFGNRSLGWVNEIGAGGSGRTGIESALMIDEYQRSGRVLDLPPTSVPTTLDGVRTAHPGGAVREVGSVQGLMDALGDLPRGSRSLGIVAFRPGPAGASVHVVNVIRYPSGPVVFIDGQLGGLGAVATIGPEGSVVLIETTEPAGGTDAAAPASLTDVPPATVAKSTEETPTAGDPIDVTTGRMILTETDAVLPGLTLTRTHRSDYQWGRSFGPSWASTLDQRLIIDHHHVRYLAADGSILTYPLPAEGEEAQPQLGRTLPLRRLTGGGWLLTEPTSGRTLVFTSGSGPESLLSDVIEGDLRWSIERDEAGTPTELRSTAGARIGFSSSAGLLTVLWLPNRSGVPQTAYRFGYDQERNLVEVVNSSGAATRFGYADARIVRWDDRNGEWYTYRYDDSGRCVSTDGRGGHLRYRFTYSDSLTLVTDSLGNVRRYELNDRFQVVAVTDPLGGTTRTEWDGANRLRSRTDALGRTTTFEYDADGRLATVTRADGSRSTIAYDELGRALSWTDFDGGTRQRAFDDDGRVLAETDAAGEVVRFDRPVDDGPGTVTQAGPTAIVRDAARQVTAMMTGSSQTSFEYDSLGRVAAIDDDHGTTQVGWTIEGELAWRENPDGTVEEFGYDGEGNLVESVDAAGRRTRFEYGAFDLVTARIDDAVNRTEYGYDTELRLTTITDPAGRRWQYTYDPNGRVTEETDFEGRTQRYAYDAAGQLVEQTDTAGTVTHFSHDLLGRVVERRTGTAVTRLVYDAAGRVVAAEDADSTIELTRDAFGRVTTEAVNGHAVVVSYSERFGTVTARTRPSGAVTQWSYDESGRPMILVAGGQQLRFAYEGGREVSRGWDAGPTIEPPTVPGAGPDQHPGEPGEIGYTLDQLGRATSRSGASGDWHFTWDHQNRLATVTTPGDDRWRYRYDAFDRRIAKQRADEKGVVIEETTFVWSGDLLVEEHHRDGDGRVTTTAWEYHPTGTYPVAQVSDGTAHAVVTDDAGTPVHLVGTDGSRPTGPDGIPLRRSSRYLDAETGLHYDGSRYYDPMTARFLPQPRQARVPVN
ncbi:DUF6531 domain-containing protein [Micromonospora sp. NPDC048898]|uniref:DUF6531 domain-containing protein n=1 Tax=Micromonospora sp. NPDC048898 TaxID=3364260 RepID=UPI003722C374